MDMDTFDYEEVVEWCYDNLYQDSAALKGE